MILKSKLGIGMAIAAALCVGAVQDSVTLRRQLTEGQTDIYAMSMKGKEIISTPFGLGDQEVTTESSMKLTLATGKVDATLHKAGLTMTASDIKFDVQAPMVGAMPKPDIPKQLVTNGFIDDHNRILDVKLPAGPGSGPGTLSATDLNTFLFVEYPDVAVKSGDKWEITLPKSPTFGDKEIKLGASFVGGSLWKGTDAWEIKASGTIPLNIDVNKVMKGQKDPTGMLGNMKILVKGTLDVDIDAFVEKSTGRVLKMVAKTKGKQTLEMVDRGMSIPMSNDSTTIMELQR